MVTQQDVAKKAGVSFITVSRVINNNGYVKKETREKVMQTIKELNYYPNHIGRALHIKSVNTIGIIIPAPVNVAVHAREYFNLLMAGIEKSTMVHDYDFLLSTYPREEPQVNYLRLYFQGKVDGLILLTPDLNHLQMKDILRYKIPCVIIGERPVRNIISFVDTDNFNGMYHITEHLIGKNHRDIGFIKGIPSMRNSIDRWEGFFHAMVEHNLPVNNEWILDGDFTPESGQSAFKKLISSGGKIPTALICANDLMALGALSEAKNSQIKIPEELALIGFDGIEMTAFTDPPLTTARQPLFEMGFTASEMLFAKIKDPERLPESKIFPVELIKRNSA